MEKLWENLANLLKVKTIVTFTVVLVFAVLSFMDRITADQVMVIASMVISFYFGTQQEKKGA